MVWFASLSSHPKTLKIDLVGWVENRTGGKFDRIARAFKNQFSQDDVHTFAGIPIELSAPQDDGADPDRAEQLAKDLAKAPDTLLVVGHGRSSCTKAALPVYLQEAKPPIPVIMTTDTNPSLMPPNLHGETQYPVMRLSPTDSLQAEKATWFCVNALQQEAQSREAAQNSVTRAKRSDSGTAEDPPQPENNAFWVVEDVSNPAYSEFLSQAFIHDLQNQNKRVLLWSTNMNIPDANAMRALGIGWVFFAGTWPNALMVVQQAKAMLGTNVRIMLSESCADPKLLQEGLSDVDGVYLTALMKADEFNQPDDYGSYGHDAAMLVEELLKGADAKFADLAAPRAAPGFFIRRLLRMYTLADARNALDAYIEQSLSPSGREFHLANGKRLRFDEKGDRAKVSFNIWKVKPDKDTHQETFSDDLN